MLDFWFPASDLWQSVQDFNYCRTPRLAYILSVDGVIIIIIIINFSQRRVPQKAKMPVQGGPQKQTDIHTYNYKK